MENTMIVIRETDTVGDLVATNFRAAGVFERVGIDFCCGGRRSLSEACHAAGVPLDGVVQELRALVVAAPPDDDDPRQWPLPRVVEHILERHHRYVREALPRIAGFLSRLVAVHAVRHPELTTVEAEFFHLQEELKRHMFKEEQVLFPYIRELAATEATARPLPASPFGTVENPIRMMEREHQEAGDDLRTIRDLTNGYVTPDDGCATYRVAMAELQQFERDLHEHIHLENNVLFPRAVAVERRLAV
jgi:regulator of cell morphogenesis and NO signaling